MLPLSKWFIFLFFVCNNMECLYGGIYLQEQFTLGPKPNSTDGNAIDNKLDDLSKKAAKKSDSQSNSAKYETSFESPITHPASSVETHGSTFKSENVQDSTVQQRESSGKMSFSPSDGSFVSQPKDMSNKMTSTPVPPPPMTKTEGESREEFKKVNSTKPVEHETKDVENLKNNQSESKNASAREVGEWTGNIRSNSNDTELAVAAASVGSVNSLLCLENVCSVITYFVMFTIPYYYHVGLDSPYERF